MAVTETDAIAHALVVAAQRWPAQDDEARRQSMLSATSGTLTGVYAPDYLAEFREDWPE